MIDFPGCLQSFVGLYVCGISKVEELFTCLTFLVVILLFFFPFSLTKNGTVGGDEV